LKIGKKHSTLALQTETNTMKKVPPLFLFYIFLSLASNSQEGNSDSSKTLGEVTVKAFEQYKQLKQTSAAINFIGQSQLARFNNTNILPALNSTPGVRMEERSPGSYRMNIRGSTLRSPFGVRNVKIYFDDIPFTDAGGNSYLNQLSFYNFNSIEIIKGPGGSLYGAGTGGVILINIQPTNWKRSFDATISGGSYGLLNGNLQLKAGNDKWQNVLSYSHQNSDGYRHHTQMYREVLNWQTKIAAGKKDELKFTVLYGDLYYQTPGALTKAEYDANARAARPKAGTLPSADSAKAAIFQKMILGGITNEYKFSDRFDNRTTVYSSFVELKNPTFRNYEKRREPQWGARTVFKWKKSLNKSLLQIVFGSEFQSGSFNTKDWVNKNGSPGAIMTDDNIHPQIYSLFAQMDLALQRNWSFSFGLSTNETSIKINRVSVANFKPVKKEYNNELAPRFAISKKLFSNFWLYSSISKGFSPPTVAEVLPSTTVISTNLQAEHGINYETGLKSSWLNQRLYLEVNAFYYRLKNAIVQRKDSSNADYFINAGSTKQRGIESQISYQFVSGNINFLPSAKVWVSHTWNKFNYDQFKQSTTDYSGKQLPSVAPHTVAAGADLAILKGFYLNLSFFHSERIALNDANTEFASSYNLASMRLGWKKSLTKKIQTDLFAGGENLFNEKYSLGNDINAAGGRYYNVAPARSFYGGVSLHFN
jgi:iron complex outermembrane receptor protein